MALKFLSKILRPSMEKKLNHSFREFVHSLETRNELASLPMISLNSDQSLNLWWADWKEMGLFVKSHLDGIHELGAAGGKGASMSSITPDHILEEIFQNRRPMRDFRVRTQGKVPVWFGDSLDHLTYIELKQLSKTGLLFKVDSPFLKTAIASSPLLVVEMNLEFIERILEMHRGDLISLVSDKGFMPGLLGSSAGHGGNKHSKKSYFYLNRHHLTLNEHGDLFVKYTDLFAEKNSYSSDLILRPFVMELETSLTEVWENALD